MNTQDKLVGKTITVIDKYGYQNLSLRKLTATLGLCSDPRNSDTDFGGFYYV